MELFRVKICGVTCVDDALAAADAGADALGLNFFSGSRRHVGPNAAQGIVEVLPAGIAKVGVFVNAAVNDILQIVETLGLDLVQLHGDEPPQFCAALGGRDFIRAFRLGSAGWQALVDYLEACRHLHALPRAILVDAHQVGAYGGTGRTADWELARGYHGRFDIPLILAGGLDASNVADAVRAVRPFGVDTASGVEKSPGQKDRERMNTFVAAARQALNETP